MKSRSTPRRYRMTRRAASVDDTRRRITEAAVRLHTTVGPANTSIASVAGEAGVTRLTVYRHFDDLEALFAACRAHWRAANPPPDPSRWATILDTDVRAREAFTDMYGWFRDHADELRPIYRDIDAMPASSRAATRADTIALASLVCGPDLPGGDGGRQRLAVACHLLDYRTWRSLAIDQELPDRIVVDIAVAMLLAVPVVTAPSGSGGATGSVKGMTGTSCRS